MTDSTNSRMLKVAEIFDSIDGEFNGCLGQGQLTTFIRLGGCNLECSYCDTEWCQPKDSEHYKLMTFREIELECHQRHITITGGEPLLQREELSQFLIYMLQNYFAEAIKKDASRNGERRYITIETNGTEEPIYFQSHDILQKYISYVVDYKLPSSGAFPHARDKFVFPTLCNWDAIKFVVADEDDFDMSLRVIVEYAKRASYDHLPAFIFSPLMPSIGLIENELEHEWSKTLIQKMLTTQLLREVGAVFSIQIHKLLEVR